jgi:hypothetical protein
MVARELHLVIEPGHLHQKQRHKNVRNPTRTLAARPHAGRFLAHSIFVPVKITATILFPAPASCVYDIHFASR